MKRHLYSVALILLLVACATPADRQAMVPQSSASAARQLPYSVSVAATGGAETGNMDSSNIGNADLKAAVEESIKKSRLFSEVVNGRPGDYDLGVQVIQLNKPMLGFSFTVEMEAGWTLVRASDKKVLLRRVLKSTHTTGAGEAFAGVTRLRMAVEGAARKNIEQGLAAIAAAEF